MTQKPPGGLFGVLKNGAALLLDAGQTRLALLANEIEVEKLRAFRLLLLAQALMFCLGLALVFAASLTVLLLWEHKTVVVAGLVATFSIASWFFYHRLVCVANEAPALFDVTLAELQKDVQQLKAAAP